MKRVVFIFLIAALTVLVSISIASAYHSGSVYRGGTYSTISQGSFNNNNVVYSGFSRSSRFDRPIRSSFYNKPRYYDTNPRFRYSRSNIKSPRFSYSTRYTYPNRQRYYGGNFGRSRFRY